MMQDYVILHVIQDIVVLDQFAGVHAQVEHSNVELYVWLMEETVLVKF